MVSEFALGEIAELEARGLKPTARDIIRLNALGVKVECAKESCELYTIPRVAFLGDIAFREPTIGHEQWLRDVNRYVDMVDFGTFVAVNAYALSRNFEQLPDPLDRKLVDKEVTKFMRGDIARFTMAQIQCAINYASNGDDADAHEYPAIPSDEKEAQDVEASIAIGVVHEGVAVGLGLSVHDAYNMTRPKLMAVIHRALEHKGVDVSRTVHGTASSNFWQTLDEIKARLKKESEVNG